VIAAEYAHVLLQRLKAREGASSLIGRIARHRQGVVAGLLTVVIASYLATAQWAMPRADVELSFLPLTEHIQTLQANGQQVALFQANERLGGATVFYTQRVIKGLNTEAQLHEFLTASPSNVVVMAAEVEPGPPLKVLKVMQVGRQNYYFIGQ
jgi:hypothetical protein